MIFFFVGLCRTTTESGGNEMVKSQRLAALSLYSILHTLFYSSEKIGVQDKKVTV